MDNKNLAKTDKEILDYLETQYCWIGVYGEFDLNQKTVAGAGYGDFRAAIIKLMQKEGK